MTTKRWMVIVAVVALHARAPVRADEPQAAPPLTQAVEGLSSADVKTRQQAAYALWNLGDAAQPEVVAIAAALRDDDDYVRATVTRVLERWRADTAPGVLEPAREQLLEALADGRSDVRRAGAKLLWRSGALPAPFLEHAFPALLGCLEDDDPQLLATAAALVAQRGADGHAALSRLTVLTTHEDPEVRTWALQAIGAIAPREAVPDLIARLADEDAAARSAAAFALAATGEPWMPEVDEAILAEAQRDPPRMTELQVVQTAWAHASPRMVPLLERMARNAKDPQARSSAVHALAQQVDRDALDVLLAAARDPDASVRVAAVSALGNLGVDAAPALPLLLAVIDGEDANAKQAAYVALARLGPAALPARTRVLDALDAAPPADAFGVVAAVAGLANDGFLEEEDAARIVPRLAAVLDAVHGTHNPTGAWQACAALAALRALGAGATDALARCVTCTTQPTLPAMALNVLRRIGPPAAAAVPVLREVAKQESLDGGNARFALVSIAATPEDVEQGIAWFREGLADEQQQSLALSLAMDAPKAWDAIRPQLVQLAEGDGRNAMGACVVLVALGHPADGKALEKLVAALADGRVDRWTGLLSELGPEAASAADALAGAAPTATDGGRSAIARALGRIGVRSDAVRTALAELRNDSSPWIRTRAAVSQARLGFDTEDDAAK
ncbi:MAG: HEAT repeat domain-containing protein [Planctomycetes bacterium]|nr:HEAT repeat domain-containing protein [Planctomycetota bacterium]